MLDSMPGDGPKIRELFVPRMGAGQQEVRIVSLAKRAGDRVGAGETIYTVESDKALIEIECPSAGTLIEWLTVEDTVLQIGAPVARVLGDEVADACDGAVVGECTHGIIDSSDHLSAPRPADIHGRYVDRGISPAHRAFVMRIRRSQDLVVPSVIKRSMDWGTVCRVAEAHNLYGKVQPSPFQTFAFAVAQSAKAFPKLRSTMPADDVVREYEHVNLGIAVGLPNGQLNIAVVENADALGYDDFIHALQRNIVAARMGRDQANESVQLLLTYMGGYEVDDSIPLLVAPAVAVVFLGSPYDREEGLRANLTMTFDHRLIQGVEAAIFLKTVAQMSGDAATWPVRAVRGQGES